MWVFCACYPAAVLCLLPEKQITQQSDNEFSFAMEEHSVNMFLFSNLL
jgi:hypothetical protein